MLGIVTPVILLGSSLLKDVDQAFMRFFRCLVWRPHQCLVCVPETAILPRDNVLRACRLGPSNALREFCRFAGIARRGHGEQARFFVVRNWQALDERMQDILGNAALAAREVL